MIISTIMIIIISIIIIIISIMIIIFFIIILGPRISDWCYTAPPDTIPPTVKSKELYETIRLLGEKNINFNNHHHNHHYYCHHNHHHYCHHQYFHHLHYQYIIIICITSTDTLYESSSLNSAYHYHLLFLTS